MTFRFDRALKHTYNLPKPFMACFPVEQGSSQRLRWKGAIPSPVGGSPWPCWGEQGRNLAAPRGAGPTPQGSRSPSARSWVWGHPGSHVPPGPVAMAEQRRPVMAAAWNGGQPWCGVSVTESRFTSLPFLSLPRTPSLLSTTWPAPQLPYFPSPCLPPLPHHLLHALAASLSSHFPRSYLPSCIN